MDGVRSVPNRSIVLAGHKTGISLEDEFWKGLKEIAQERHMKRPGFVGGHFV
jgi:predicted DNA-binding ribbon-helix-helix protein